MKKQKKQMILLLILLIAAVAGYFLLKAYNEQERNKKAEQIQANQIYVWNISKDDIQKISYTYQDTDYSFQRDGDNWIYPADTSVPINKSNMELMAGSAARIEAEDKIENVTDLEQYGLSQPSQIIEIVTKDQTHHLYIGDYNTTIGDYYVYLDDSSTVYTIKSNFVTCYNRTLDDLKEKPEETAAAPEETTTTMETTTVPETLETTAE